MIHADWIQHVIEHPGREVIRTDGRIRRWAPIGEMDGSHLRVVLLSDGEAVHNAFFDHSLSAMKVKYFQDTDTLYIGFRVGGVVETKDLDENTQLDLDAKGNICALTVEHAARRPPAFLVEQVGT